MKPRESILHRIRRNIRNKLIAGLIVTIPVLSTLFIFQWVFSFWDQFLNRPIVREYKEYYFPGLGILISLLVIYLAGVAVTNYLGSKLFHFFERILHKIPVIRNIYSAIKQVVTTVTAPNKASFKKVVLVDFPRTGVRMVGFLTAYVRGMEGKDYCMIFLPTTPNPTTGYFAIYPKNEVQDTEISVEDGMKMIVSGGIISSEKLSPYLPWEHKGNLK